MNHTSHTRAVRFLSGLFYFFSILMLNAPLITRHLNSVNRALKRIWEIPRFQYFLYNKFIIPTFNKAIL
ncbi:MAG: hypothetical protein IPL67_00815 [Ignavibacteria bacterium]|nr:hypothetical protein [Ignavibacteria bacterium]